MADPVPAASFELLHPAVQHHVVNSLGWRRLRPLQTATIEPILAGDHLIATAPTAGGKTEAAVLPLLSRILSEDWRGLSVLYVCPLRALLNDLHQRLDRYGQLIGRRVGRWHGDVDQSERDRLLAEPPDILLTTPESLEAMLVSPRVPHERWFADVRAVVVDEVHAFAGDDRGWHLLAVLERITRIAGREVQRIALSATLSNPASLLAWLTATCRGPAQVVNPPAQTGPAEVTLDHVGTLANAALVISRLHRGEKRLVFVDSRARAEQLAVALRSHDVTTFVSHGSLGAGQRSAAEQAFAENRDCVIVATSTLELGIDVGDLDRVIQIDAPPTVTAFLQRLGRSGRRPDTTRHALVLATGDDALLRATAVFLRWAEGYVEPIVPPPAPLHLVAQQLLALCLQERGVGRRLWAEWLGEPLRSGLRPPRPRPRSPTTWSPRGSSWTTAASWVSAERPRRSLAAGTSWSCCRRSPRRPSSASATAGPRSAWSPTRPSWPAPLDTAAVALPCLSSPAAAGQSSTSTGAGGSSRSSRPTSPGWPAGPGAPNRSAPPSPVGCGRCF